MKSQPSKMNYKTGLRKINEMNVAGGPGGMFAYGGGGGDIGTYGGAVGNNDFYAAGDARIPTSIYGGKVLTRAGTTGNGEKRKKRKKGKKASSKKTKKSSFKEAFKAEVSVGVDDMDYTLACMIYSQNEEYHSLITDLLEQQGIFYNASEDAIIIEGTDEHLQNVLAHVEGLVTPEPFETGAIVAFIGEMDVTLQKPQKDEDEYNQEQLKMGIAVEMEHIDEENTDKEEARGIAAIIAMNHLDEDPEYYTKLKKVESGH
jgi:hypothetical protein